MAGPMATSAARRSPAPWAWVCATAMEPSPSRTARPPRCIGRGRPWASTWEPTPPKSSCWSTACPRPRTSSSATPAWTAASITWPALASTISSATRWFWPPSAWGWACAPGPAWATYITPRPRPCIRCRGLAASARRRAGRSTLTVALRQQGRQGGRQALEDLQRQRAGEFVFGGVGLAHVGGEGAEEVLADEEHEGRGAAHHPGFQQSPATPENLVAVVAGTGFAAGLHRPAVGAHEGPLEAAGRTVVHHRQPAVVRHLRHLLGQQAFTLGLLPGEARLVGGGRGEMEVLEARRGVAHPLVHDDAHQFRQGRRPVCRTADGGGVGRREGLEGVAEPAPGAADLQKSLHLQQALDAHILCLNPRKTSRDLLQHVSRPDSPTAVSRHRSEERRVGKECRSRWSPYH